MKNTIVLIFVTSFTVNTVTSQITKRNWLVGGNGEFLTQKLNSPSYPNGDYTTTRISVSPKIGYFPIDHLALGLLLKYEHVAEKSAAGLKTVYANIGIGPFVRYYFLPSAKSINILVEGNGAYTQTSSSSVSTKPSYLSYALLTGPVIYFNSSVGVEFLFGYKGNRSTKEGDIKTDGFHFNIGIQVHLEKNK